MSGNGAFGRTTLNNAVDAMTSQMTSYFHYIMTLAGKLLKKRTWFLSSKCPGANFAYKFVVCPLILNPAESYFVWTKHSHRQICFDIAVNENRDKIILSWSCFWRHLGAIGKKVTPSVNWTFDKHKQDIVNGIAGVMNINRSVVFCVLKLLWTLWKAHARLSSRFLTLGKTPPSRNWHQILKFSINTVALIY